MMSQQVEVAKVPSFSPSSLSTNTPTTATTTTTATTAASSTTATTTTTAATSTTATSTTATTTIPTCTLRFDVDPPPFFVSPGVVNRELTFAEVRACIESGQVQWFGRTQEQIVVYSAYLDEIKAVWPDMSQYLLVLMGFVQACDVLQDESGLKKMIRPGVVDKLKATKQTVWRENDYGYPIEQPTKHFVYWTTDSFDSLTPDFLRKVVDARFCPTLFDTLFFVNPPALQSVRGLGHAHCFVKPKAAAFLAWGFAPSSPLNLPTSAAAPASAAAALKPLPKLEFSIMTPGDPVGVRYGLRPFVPSDAPSLSRYANNIKVWRNLRDRFPHPYSLDDARSYIETMQTKQPLGSALCIYRMLGDGSSEAIGSIASMQGVDVHRRTAEIGYFLGEPFWGLGIMGQAVKLFVEMLLPRFELLRVFASIYAHNVGSARVLTKAGFVLEGKLQNYAWKEGKAVDCLMYARISSQDTCADSLKTSQDIEEIAGTVAGKMKEPEKKRQKT